MLVVLDQADHLELELFVIGRFDHEGIAQFDFALARSVAVLGVAVLSVDGGLLARIT